MSATFTWTPDFGGNRDTEPRVTRVQFGDGYEQRVPNGLNTMPAKFNLTFENREEAEKNQIIAFLKARAGVQNFNWTPPGETTPLKFVCRKWADQFVKANRYTISASFEQVFEP